MFLKIPDQTCGVSDDLSGDMLAPSWPNLVYSLNLHVPTFKMETAEVIRASLQTGSGWLP